jgi:hypothetical protein
MGTWDSDGCSRRSPSHPRAHQLEKVSSKGVHKRMVAALLKLGFLAITEISS